MCYLNTMPFIFIARQREQNKFTKKCYPQWGLNLGPIVIHCDSYLLELTWQVLSEGYLTSLLLLVQKSKNLSLTSNGKLAQSDNLGVTLRVTFFAKFILLFHT